MIGSSVLMFTYIWKKDRKQDTNLKYLKKYPVPLHGLLSLMIAIHLSKNEIIHCFKSNIPEYCFFIIVNKNIWTATTTVNVIQSGQN